MAGTDVAVYARVVVIAPTTRVELSLPADVPLIELLPTLLDMVGERNAEAGELGGWRLSRAGGGELPGERTLRSLDILDGTALRLTPREAEVAPPVYDDVVDAIASVVRSRLGRAGMNPAAGAAAIVVGLLVAAVTLLYRGHSATNAYVAVSVAVVCMGVGAAISRGPGEHVIATALGGGGVPFAFLVGLDAVPGDLGRSSVLAGFAVATCYAALALATLATGAIVFISAAISSLFGVGAALVSTAWKVHPLYTAAGVCAVGLGALTVLPWLVVRLSRLPLPVVATTSAGLREASDEIDLDDVTARTRVADEFYNGAVIGCALAVAFASAVVALHGTALSVLLAACSVGALMLRTRTVPGATPRVAILGIGLFTALVTGAVAVLSDAHRASVGLLAAALAVAVVGVLVSVVAPRAHLSPTTLRAMDFLESALLIAVVPLAVGVMNLYETLRHL